MDDRYNSLRHALALVVTLLVALTAAPAAAQYMYLDANGDGIHTEADVVPPGGPVTFDVWLTTDRNRDGSTAVCAVNPADSLTFNSYTFILRATNGTVSWSGFVNRMTGFTVRLGRDSSATEYFGGYGSGTILAPGTYKVASLTASILRGTPAIAIVPNPAGITPIAITSFGCRCMGADQDNTMKLGTDWLEADGLSFGGVPNRGVVLTGTSGISVAEGEVVEQTFTASDADGDSITIVARHLPGYATLTTTRNDPGSASATLRLAPGYSDAGSTEVEIEASDGATYEAIRVLLQVTNVNRPPVFHSISDMVVSAGAVAEQTITASDPDGGSLHFTKTSGPEFMTVTSSSTSAVIRLAPDPSVGGAFTAGVSVSDGIELDQETFTITVGDSKHMPEITTNLPLMEVHEGDVAEQTITASDADGDPLTFAKEEGPAFLDVRTVNSGIGQATGKIVAAPLSGDQGFHVAMISVSDGLFHVSMSLIIHVSPGLYVGETSLTMSGDPGDPVLGGQSRRSGRRDGPFSGRALSPSTVVFTVLGPDTLFDIELSPRSALRSLCVSRPASQWSLEFSSPAGQPLAVGVYEGAIRSADDDSPGLAVQGCLGCAAITGRFEIKELEVRSDGVVRSAWITFEQRCDGASGSLHGELRFNARAFPISIETPSHLLAGVADDVVFTVAAVDSAGGAVTLSATGLPAGATFESVRPGGATFSWRPSFEQIGPHRITLEAENAAGDRGSAFCDITVRPRNAVTAVVDANEVELFTSNRGTFAYDLRDHSSGILFPYLDDPAQLEPALGTIGGLWIGALVNGAPRLAMGGDPAEFVPGPLRPAPTAADPRFKNYRIVRGSSDAPDWREWPRDQGAPSDPGGAPNLPGDVAVWSVYNDGNAAAHTGATGGTAPLGIEVRQTAWSLRHAGPLGRTVFLRFQIRNAGANHLDKAYAGIWLDPRVLHLGGGHVAIPYNELVGCDTTRDLGFAYSTMESFPDGYPSPSLGLALLRGPVPTGSEWSSPLGMVAFRRFGSALPSTPQGAYDVMRGLREDGTPLHERNDPAAPVTTFELTGDPVTGTGWLDSNPGGYDARQILLSSGPFDMAPGDSQTVEVALVVGRGLDRIHSVTDLRASLDALRGGAGANAPPSVAVSNEVYGQGFRVDEGARLELTVRATDADGDHVVLAASGLPEGAEFTDSGHGTGRFVWTPGFDQAGLHGAAFLGTDGLGASGSTSIEIEVRDVNRPPVARSGGPYHGVAGSAIEFDASGSIDPDGNPLFAVWSFGDATTASGTRVAHVYEAPGTYAVVLVASDSFMADRESTEAIVTSPVHVRAFTGADAGPIRLAAPGAIVPLSIEFEGGVPPEPFDATAVTLESHGTGSRSVALAVAGESRAGVDQDGNGTAEITLGFRKEDLRALFDALPEGRTIVTAILSGSVGKGPTFAAPIQLTIEATRRPLAVLVAPNPINPQGMLTFVTTRPGRARVELYDVRGRRARTLLDSQGLPAGYHDVSIDGRDDRGAPLPSGLYFYRIEATEGATSGRITILK